MKSLFSFSILIVAFFSFFISAEAHGGESTVAPDAPTLVRQAIDISTGLQDANGAIEKAQLALYAKGTDLLDRDKLNQAIELLKKSDQEQARKYLAVALREDPQKTNVLELVPKYKTNMVNTIFLILSVLFILLGIFITRYVSKFPYKKNTNLSDMKPVS